MKVPARVERQPIRESEHIILCLWTGWLLRLLLGALGWLPSPCCLFSFQIAETLQSVLRSDVCQTKKIPNCEGVVSTGEILLLVSLGSDRRWTEALELWRWCCPSPKVGT